MRQNDNSSEIDKHINAMHTEPRQNSQWHLNQRKKNKLFKNENNKKQKHDAEVTELSYKNQRFLSTTIKKIKFLGDLNR